LGDAPFAALRVAIGLVMVLASASGLHAVQSDAPSPSHTPAQGTPAPITVAAGRVVLPRVADTVPVSGARVVLHRVGRDSQGPLDSASADASGRFRFRFRADTAAIYLLSARWGGVEYFSPPVHTNPARPDTTIRLVVYDTSSTAPIGVEARHIVVPRAGPDGARSVLDLIVLRNDGRLARVAPDSSRPSWRLVLPPGTGDMQGGESDLSPDAVVRQGDTVEVLAPLAPGQKQLSLEYSVTPVRGKLEFPVGSGGPVNLLVEETNARVSGGTLALADSQVIEGRSFRRYTGDVPAGGTVVLVVGTAAAAAASRLALPVLVGAVAVMLAAAAWWLIRRPPRRAAALLPERMLDAIAALDARYAGREAETAEDEWRRYAAERARLKTELERTLAARGRSPYS
jgi:hypothetical protein